MPDGSIRGQSLGVEPATQSYVLVRLSPAMHIGPWLAVAGEIVATAILPQFSVGQTYFAVFDDNGNGDRLAVGQVPTFLGNLSIQQIVSMIGPPPAAAFSPFIQGNIRVL